jgi:hypothetical protein
LEICHSSHEATPIGFWDVLAFTSFRDRNLFSASQAGLVNNLNDGMSWGIFPLLFASFGLSVERIGILKASRKCFVGRLAGRKNTQVAP